MCADDDEKNDVMGYLEYLHLECDRSYSEETGSSSEESVKILASILVNLLKVKEHYGNVHLIFIIYWMQE